MMAPNPYVSNLPSDEEKTQDFQFNLKGRFFNKKSEGDSIAEEIAKILRIRLHNDSIEVTVKDGDL